MVAERCNLPGPPPVEVSQETVRWKRSSPLYLRFALSRDFYLPHRFMFPRLNLLPVPDSECSYRSLTFPMGRLSWILLGCTSCYMVFL